MVAVNLKAGQVVEREWAGPRRDRRVRIAFTRENWPAGEVARLEIWRSDLPDRWFWELQLWGGVALDKAGQPLLQTQVVWRVPADLDWVRARLIVVQNFRTDITREVL